MISGKGNDMGSSRMRDQPRTGAAHLAPPPAPRPVLAPEVPRFMLLEREVEDEFRPRMLQGLQHKVHTLAEASRQQAPICPGCSHPMRYQDQPAVSWLTRFGRLRARASRYRCPACKQECVPCWSSWAWNRDVSAARWHACWRCWGSWCPMSWPPA